jgi:hypothetical protein
MYDDIRLHYDHAVTSQLFWLAPLSDEILDVVTSKANMMQQTPNVLGARGTDLFFRYQTSGRQLIGCLISQAALYSLMLLMMGKTVARNMSS